MAIRRQDESAATGCCGDDVMPVEQDSSPIIVYGAPRSGTTYLIHILNKHPDVFISTETRVFVWAHRSLEVLTNEFYAVFHERERFVNHLRGAYPDLIRAFYRQLAPEARYWGDKNPHYAAPRDQGCLETIDRLFPGSRFIHIVRDGRAVATSIMRKGWEGFDTAHEWWTGYTDLGSAFGKTLSPARYLEIKYEDLVSNDLEIARRIFDFLAIDLHDNVIEHCRKQMRDRVPINRPTRDLTDDVPTSNWQRLLAPDGRLRSLNLLGSQLVRYGYETEASLAEAREKVTLQCTEAVIDPVREAVRRVVPDESTVLVASLGDERLLLNLDGRRGWHFPQTGDNVFASEPQDGTADAIRHLKDLRRRGSGFMLIPDVAFGWLDRLEGFRNYLDSRHRRVWGDARCLIYDLSHSPKENEPHPEKTIPGG
jgi:hypothetical protein